MQTHTETLDLEDLRQLTSDNQELMNEILLALIEDSEQQATALDAALKEGSASKVAQVARQAARTCMNVGANSVAEAFRAVERSAGLSDLSCCAVALDTVRAQVKSLRAATGG